MYRKGKLTGLVAVFIVMCLVFTGCGSSQKEEKKAPEGAFITVENQTGKDITALQIRKTGDQDFGDSLLVKDKTIKNEKKSKVKFQKKAFTKKQKKQAFDIQLTYSDGSTATLSEVPLADVKKSMTIQTGDDVTYVSYTSKKSGDKTDTKDAELKIKAAADAAQQQAAAAASQQASSTASTTQRQTGGSGSTGAASTGSSGSSGASGQAASDDKCVDPNEDVYN
ncbi:MAG: hypothetical protein I3I98_02995 [Mobilibacterium timonense]|uniref:hypothetical protein n=1 Tax=Mobilibacterium timonense TaxID=1871012 RepID=UPI002354A389|nr:hypothetical protein [Mobilibacterium timonense]MBM6990361.1 hypothetical protein [Mobilibacterium timonense]